MVVPNRPASASSGTSNDYKIPKKIRFNDSLKIEPSKMEKKVVEEGPKQSEAEKIVIPLAEQLVTQFLLFLQNDSLVPKWLCPLCNCYDGQRGTISKTDVEHHIIKKHAQFLDIQSRAYQVTKPFHGFECRHKFCTGFFLPTEMYKFVSHMVHNHGILQEKVAELNMNLADFQPVQWTPKKHFDRTTWICLRCNTCFVKFSELSYHLGHVHYFDRLTPRFLLQQDYKQYHRYKCQMQNCEVEFKTSSALLHHELREHQVLDKFIGHIVEKNDLFAKLI